jgi:hypothetical protein
MTTRRDLLKGALALPLAAQVKTPTPAAAAGTRPVVIASANGLKAVEKAYSVLAAGRSPRRGPSPGSTCRDDPNDVTAAGGLPTRTASSS